MSQMVERVAKAIEDLDGTAANFSELYRNMARAAIEALREPTKAMIAAGNEDTGIDGYVNEFWPAVPYQAMIDAALKE